MTLQISIAGVEMNSLQSAGSSKLEMTSSNPMDENSFAMPNKVSIKLLNLLSENSHLDQYDSSLLQTLPMELG